MTPISRRNFLKLSSLAAAATATGRIKSIQWVGIRPAYAADLSPELHLLNRITWAIRPEDIQRIQEMGLSGYLDWQLNPEAIEDPAVDAFLNEYPVLTHPFQQVSDTASIDYSLVHEPALWGRLYRAIYSERQLFELVVEFWTDHFNVPIADLLAEKVIDDREVVRKHALGKFRDLLFASAQSPAMLYYLNNRSSDKVHPNENYSREVMELHTLGVDGGYTEGDVKALARILTGWTVSNNGEFTFNRDMHDDSEKVFLGATFPAGRGIEEGLQALDMLASHPSTAGYVSHKLCRRFVSDTPPDSLIESTTQVFLMSDGDIRQVLRHILTSSEFNAAPLEKFRRPLDIIVAIFRVLRDGLTLHDISIPVWWFLEPMGQMPYYWHPPNGYPDAAGAWMNTSGLMNRWNVAMLIPLAAEGWYEGMTLDLSVFGPAPATVGELVDQVVQWVLEADIHPTDREQIIYYLSDYGDPNQPASEGLLQERLTSLLGILMASPYFQWH